MTTNDDDAPELELEEYVLHVADQAGYARDDPKQALLGGLVIAELEGLRRRAMMERMAEIRATMPAGVGERDKCPCGSGRLAGQCCLRKGHREAARLKELMVIRPDDVPRLDGPLYEQDLERIHALLGSDPDLGKVRLPQESLSGWVARWEQAEQTRTGAVPAADPDDPSNATLLADLNAWVRAEHPLALVKLERAANRAAPRFALDAPTLRSLALLKVLLVLGEQMPELTERLVGFLAEWSGEA